MKSNNTIETIAKLYVAMLLQYKEDFKDLDSVDKTIITSEEIFKKLLNWINETEQI